MNLSGRQVSLGLYGRAEYWHKHITFKTPIDNTHEIIEKINFLYDQWEDKFKVIKFAVRISLLQPKNQNQLLPNWQKNESIQTALDLVNDKYGLFTIHPAAIPPANEIIYPEVTGFLGDKLYQLDE